MLAAEGIVHILPLVADLHREVGAAVAKVRGRGGKGGASHRGGG